MLQGRRQLVDRLVAAVKDEAVWRDAGGECDVQLAAGCDIEVHALLVSQTGHGAAQKGLGGVGDAVAPRRDRVTAGVAQMVLVVHEERRAESLRQLQQVDAADVEVAPVVDRPRTREELPLQRRCRDVVVDRHGDAGYGSIRLPGEGGEGARCLASTIVPCSVTPAPVAQRIEHRPPEPVAQVRVLPGALSLSQFEWFPARAAPNLQRRRKVETSKRAVFYAVVRPTRTAETTRVRVADRGFWRSPTFSDCAHLVHAFRAASGPVIRLSSGNVEVTIASATARPPNTAAQ